MSTIYFCIVLAFLADLSLLHAWLMLVTNSSTIVLRKLKDCSSRWETACVAHPLVPSPPCGVVQVYCHTLELYVAPSPSPQRKPPSQALKPLFSSGLLVRKDLHFAVWQCPQVQVSSCQSPMMATSHQQIMSKGRVVLIRGWRGRVVCTGVSTQHLVLYGIVVNFNYVHSMQHELISNLSGCYIYYGSILP